MRQKRKFQVGFLQVPHCCEVWSEFGPPERSAGAAAVGLQPQTVVCRAVNACIEAVGVNGLITKRKKKLTKESGFLPYPFHIIRSISLPISCHPVGLFYTFDQEKEAKQAKVKDGNAETEDSQSEKRECEDFGREEEEDNESQYSLDDETIFTKAGTQGRNGTGHRSAGERSLKKPWWE